MFRHTSAYDALIAEYLTKKTGEWYPDLPVISQKQDLRYGENPHQSACFYQTDKSGIAAAEQLHGKELSYNNIQDANAALEIILEFDEPAVVAVKHMNPCGVGIASDITEAWNKAYNADPVSIFGGIVASNRKINKDIAQKISELFLEIVIAPEFDKEAFDIIAKKKNIRILQLADIKQADTKIVSVMGGLLIQQSDIAPLGELEYITNRKPTQQELQDLLFTWKVVKHVKSNAIVVGRDGQTYGIGAGQMNRVGAAKIALEQSKEHSCVMASDAFFPMSDTVELAAKHGITAIIQPGGSMKDQLSIDACNAHDIAMVFTGMRHFKH